MTAVAAAAVVESISERLERLERSVEEIAGELRRQRRARERWQELADELAPIAEEAMGVTIRRLGAEDFDVADLASLARAVLRDASTIEAWIGPLRSLAALADEVGPLTAPAVASLNTLLQRLDDRGYFTFVREAAGVLDTVVTSFTDEDVRLLGENIVLILQTVKQMTQPEVMGLLGRTAVSLQEVETEGFAQPPSTLALLRQMRDPEVRRGLARLLETLRAIGAQRTVGTLVPTGEHEDRR
jgi:uncharacterized protein YjgD (DUF1641 family)